MKEYIAIALLVAAPLAQSAAATPVDNYAARTILAADYAKAEAELAAHLERAPADPPALLNMAYVYRQTGRNREANLLYSRVLERADIVLTSTSGKLVMSHDLARAGLSGRVSIATR